MTTKLEALQELAKRGQLPEEYKPAYDEAVKRGLVDSTSTLGDMAKTTIPSLARGAMQISSLPGEIDQLGRNVGGWVAGKLGASDASLKALESAPRYLPTYENEKNAVESVTGPLYEPKTLPGKTWGSFLEMAPAAVAGPGSLPARMMFGAVLPSVGSEVAGALPGVKGTSNEPVAKVVGGVATSLSPMGLRRLVTPFRSSAERGAMVEYLRSLGVNPTAGQATGSKALQYAESELGGSAMANRLNEQERSFTRAALGHAGEAADVADPQTIDRAFKRIGAVYDRLGAAHNINIDQQTAGNVQNAIKEYNMLVSPALRVPLVEALGTEVLGLTGQAMPGTRYNAMREQLGRLARGTQDPNQERAFYGIINALDNSMERTLAASGNQADMRAWQDARDQYRNLIPIAKASTGAGEAAASGVITPQRLRSAQVGQDWMNYARGRGDLNQLTHAAESVLVRPPQSGTSMRMATRAAPAFLGAMLGNAVEGGSIGSMAGAAIGHAATGELLMSRPVQSYLANQLMAQGLPRYEAVRRAALVTALMGRNAAADVTNSQ